MNKHTYHQNKNIFSETPPKSENGQTIFIYVYVNVSIFNTTRIQHQNTVLYDNSTPVNTQSFTRITNIGVSIHKYSYNAKQKSTDTERSFTGFSAIVLRYITIFHDSYNAVYYKLRTHQSVRMKFNLNFIINLYSLAY